MYQMWLHEHFYGSQVILDDFLTDFIQGLRKSRAEIAESQRLLTPDEDQALLNFIDHCAALGFPLRLNMLVEQASYLREARIPPPEPHKFGQLWASRFLSRHEDYRSKWPRMLDQSRWINTGPDVAVEWFELVKHTMDKHHIPSGNCYNMDEKGAMMGVCGKTSKVSESPPCIALKST